MNNIKSLMLLPFLLLIQTVFGQTSEDTLSIRKVISMFEADFNEGSFKNAYQYTTDDWEHINPLGGIDKSRDSVLKVVKMVHQSFLRGVTMKTQSINIRFITPDVAIADVIHKMNTYTTPDGVRHENESHIKTYVVVKKNRKWLLTHDHNTIQTGMK